MCNHGSFGNPWPQERKKEEMRHKSVNIFLNKN
jgi:hypothetical protein